MEKKIRESIMNHLEANSHVAGILEGMVKKDLRVSDKDNGFRNSFYQMLEGLKGSGKVFYSGDIHKNGSWDTGKMVGLAKEF